MAKKERIDHGSDDIKKGKNPQIQVKKTESGHIAVWCDTEGATYTFNAHQSGSYTLVKHDGTSVSCSVGDIQSYGKGGMTVTCDENMDCKVHGHSRTVIGGGSYVEVAGDADIGVAGATTLFTKGNLNAHFENLYLGAKGNIKLHAGGNFETVVEGDMNTNVSGNQTNDVGGDQTHDVGGDTSLDTNKYNIDADIDHEGNMVTTGGVHKDDNGFHQ